ncbi:NAD(P)-binding domain-containing protein (plasmid) [Arthrobacter sp. Z1-9]
MNIGILGVGHIGTTLATRLSGAGHTVKVANSKDPKTVDTAVLATGAHAVWAAEAAVDVDVLILSVPFDRLPLMAPLVSDLPSSTVLIDTSNYYPSRDGGVEEINGGKVESLWAVEQLDRPLVKAWNAIGSDSLARLHRPKGAPDRIAIPVAGDSDSERAIAMALVEDTGFDAYDAGPLADSWRQQPGTPCYCTDLTLAEMPGALAAAEADRSPKRRDIAVAAIMERIGDGRTNPGADYLVRLNRALYM